MQFINEKLNYLYIVLRNYKALQDKERREYIIGYSYCCRASLRGKYEAASKYEYTKKTGLLEEDAML